MNDFVILSTKKPQYIFLSKILKKKKFNNYYFIEETKRKKINSFLENLKKSLKSKKKIKFIIYYFLQILLFKRYSRKYSFLKKKFFNYYEKKIKDKDIEVQKLRINKNFKNKILILFGSPYINSKFIKKFKFVYNIHMGILPKYAGLKSFERMMINENYIGFTFHEVSKEIDKGDIIYKKKLKINSKKDIFQNYINLYNEVFNFILKILISKTKINKNNKLPNRSDLFYGFEFNELDYKKLLKF